MEIQGIWQYFDSKNTPLPQGMQVGDLATGSDGRVWLEVVESQFSETSSIQYYDAATLGIMVYDQVDWKLFVASAVGLPRPIGTVELACDAAGYLWIHLASSPGTSVLYRFDGITSELFEGREVGLPSDVGTLKGFASDGRHRFWAAMGIMGLYYFNGAGWHKFDTSDYFPKSGHVNSIASDNLGQIWFAIQSEKETSFVRYNGSRCMIEATAPIGYQQAEIQAFVIDGQGKLWVGWGDLLGTSRLGLWVTSRLTREWIKYTSRDSALADDQVTGIAFDRVGRAWIVTVGGLTIIDGKDSVSWGAVAPGILHGPISQEEASPLMDEAIAKGESPPFLYIGGKVASDNKGRIWTTSVSGVAVFLEQ